MSWAVTMLYQLSDIAIIKVLYTSVTLEKKNGDYVINWMLIQKYLRGIGTRISITQHIRRNSVADPSDPSASQCSTASRLTKK